MNYGRQVIISQFKEINEQNIFDVLSSALTIHNSNVSDIDTLYDYYKGKQAILNREKEVRPEICNKIVVNRANEIVSFKTGYLVGEPIQYVNANEDEKVSEAISLINSYMFENKKANQDQNIADWQHICGTAYRICLATQDDEFLPFEIFSLDPRNCFVIYSPEIGNKPLACVTITQDEEDNSIYSFYTKDNLYVMTKDTILERQVNSLGELPIIEYPANEQRLGAFEIVKDLLDAINLTESNRLDGVEQFVQSLLVFYNLDLKDEDGNEITPKQIREAGCLFLKTYGDQKAEVKEYSQELSQTQTQILIDNMYQEVLTIVGMPSQGNGNTSDSSNNGAVIMRNGWQQAEARAKRSENVFKSSECEFLKVVLKILSATRNIDIRVSDIIIKFTRRNYEDIYTKVQVLDLLLKNDKVAPIDAWNISGADYNTLEACKRGLENFEKEIVRQKEMGNAEGNTSQE